MVTKWERMSKKAQQRIVQKAKEYKQKFGTNNYFYQRFLLPKIKERDKNQCVKCSSKENLVVHHKHYDTDTLTINDFETLCKRCHKKTHGGAI